MRILLIILLLLPLTMFAQVNDKPFTVGTALFKSASGSPNVDFSVELHKSILLNVNVGFKIKGDYSRSTSIGGIDKYYVKGNYQRVGLYGKHEMDASGVALMFGAHLIRSQRHEEIVLLFENDYWGDRTETYKDSYFEHAGLFDIAVLYRPEAPLSIKFSMGIAVSQYSIEDNPLQRFYSFYKPGIGNLVRINRLLDQEEGDIVKSIPTIDFTVSYRFGLTGK